MAQKNYKSLQKDIFISIILAICASIILTILAILTSRALLELVNTQPNLIDSANEYMFTIYLGLFATIFYNLSAHILRSLSDSKTPLIALIVSVLLNIGLDFLFILGFKLGVAGAGYATILSQFISEAGCWAYLLIKFPNARPNTSSLHFNFKELFLYIKISIPMAFQFSIIGIGLIIQQNAVNGLDEINNATSLIKDLYATSYVNACKINNFASGILQSLGLTMVAFCGQNYGAKKIDRI